MKNFFFLLLFPFLSACSNNQNNPSLKQENTKSSLEYSYNKTLQANGYTFTVKANMGESKTLLLESTGLDNEYRETVALDGNVKEVLMLDIDNDGHQEFYVLLMPTVEPASIMLRGFASNQSKSISEITVRDEQLTPRDSGTDQVSAENGDLLRRFSQDQKSFTFKYMLMQSEAGFLLLPRIVQ